MTSLSAAVAVLISALFVSAAEALGGTAATVAVSYGADTTTVCTLRAEQPQHQIQCWRQGLGGPITLSPPISLDYIAGGADTLCGVRSGGAAVICWDGNLTAKRVYNGPQRPLSAISVGDTQICGLTNSTSGNAVCWRSVNPTSGDYPLSEISSGLGFSCGIFRQNSSVVCWGTNAAVASRIQAEFSNTSMNTISVGGAHACGVNSSGVLICRGSNENGQLDVPSNVPYEYRGVSLGANHTCAIRRLNGSVICWGGGNNGGEFSANLSISFESIVSGLDFTCGFSSVNFSVLCWGPGWPNGSYPARVGLPLGKSLPGPCTETNCSCGVYPQSQELCSGEGKICNPCEDFTLPPSISPPEADSPRPKASRGLRRGLLAFAIVGSVGGVLGICTIIYLVWTGVCFGKKKIHNSVQPTITAAAGAQPQQSSSSPPQIFSRSSTLRRQSSRFMRRQRSGTSTKHTDKDEEFLFSDLAEATNNFSLENKIGAGSFGVVYRGKLPDGREVAIKRGEMGAKMKKMQEKESAFESELAFLSRLHHKHLVRLVGYCEERDERLLVYDYMKNGALYDHLHDKSNNNNNNNNSLVNSWRMRIKIALDAARGIEYLHNYAVPPIIHRDIKSSNILLDGNWTARVSDFGLSLMGSEADAVFRPVKAAGTVGYIDPEYYGLNVLTAKSDVYGFGVVLLELLTGKKAIFKPEESGSSPMTLVEYAVPAIRAGEMGTVLDPRVGEPGPREADAVELVAYTALHCVNEQGKDRPTMTDIVANLERALALCDESQGSISTEPLSIISD